MMKLEGVYGFIPLWRREILIRFIFNGL